MTQAEDRELPIDYGPPISDGNPCPDCGLGVILDGPCMPDCPQVAKHRRERLNPPSRDSTLDSIHTPPLGSTYNSIEEWIYRPTLNPIYDAAHDPTHPHSTSAQTSHHVFAVVAISIVTVISTTQVFREMVIICDMVMTYIITITCAIMVISMVCAIGKEDDAEW